MRPNAQQLDLLRTKPHRTKLYLGIYKPATVLACRVNDASIVKGSRSITFDGVTAGSYSLVQSGMTMYVGSTLGAHDRGRIRVKSATSSVITVSENDHIQWADSLYLTIVSFYEPWGIYQRIELVSNVPIYYKDYDIAYTDQNENFQPVVCMGPNHAGFIQTGSMGVFYTSSGTFDPTDGSAPTGHQWWFEGGLPTGSLVAHPGWVQYPNPGHFTTRLTVTSNQGKTRIGHRHIMAFNRPGEGANTPIMKWGMDSIEGSRDSFGYSANFWLRESADYANVVEGALVVVFAEHYYNWSRGLIGGNAAGREDVIFAGYIESESIRYNSYTSALKFKASSITQIMTTKQTFSVALNDVYGETPQYWYEMTDITCDRAVIHYLQWHSTILDITDFSQIGNTKTLQFADFGRGSLLDAPNSLYSSALQAQITADRQGKLWAEIDLNITATGSRPNRLSMDLTRADWLDEADILINEYPPVSYVEAGGIVYDPSAPSGTIFAYLSGAPGVAPGYEGTIEKVTGLLIDDQDNVNLMAGLLLARSQMRYPEITFRMAGAYSNFDIAPQEFVRLTVQASDTWRGLIWSNKRFIPQSIIWQANADNESLVPTLTLKEETWGPKGDTIIIPTEPPYTDNDLPDWDFPFLPIMPLPPILPPIVPEPPETEVVFAMNAGQLFRCDDIEAATPVWYEIAIPGGSYVGNLTHFWLNIYNPLDQAFIWSQYESGAAATQGPWGYLVSGLQSPTSSWTPIWTGADNQILNPGSTQRVMPFIGQSRTLGYFLGAARRSTLGSPNPVMIKGSVGSWIIGTVTIPAGGFSTGHGGNMGHLGGSTIISVGGGNAGRSDNLGNTWALDAGPGGVRLSHSLCSDGINCIWAHENQSISEYKIYHHRNGFSPGGTIYDVAVDIAPSIGGVRYDQPPSSSNLSWHTGKSIINAGGKVYMMGYAPATGDYAWFVKDTWLPTSLDWHLLYSFGTIFHMVGIDVSLVDANHIVGMRYQGVTHAGAIWYSADGGNTWIAKTGNLAALGWDAGQETTCKFALSSAALT